MFSTPGNLIVQLVIVTIAIPDCIVVIISQSKSKKKKKKKTKKETKVDCHWLAEC